MKNTFINLPIRNVADTDTFFASLGIEKNEQMSGAEGISLKINDNTYVMLLEDKRFAGFIDANPEVINNNQILCLQFDTKTEVDSFFEKAIAAGATDMTKPDPESEAFMYDRAFRDINGHIWQMFVFIAEMPKV
jgi:predicted lactoylglutathione lyase